MKHWRTPSSTPPPQTRAAAQLFWIEAGGDVWFPFNYGPEMTRYHSHADPIWPDGRVPLVKKDNASIRTAAASIDILF